MVKNLWLASLLFFYSAALQAVIATGDTVGASTTFQFSLGSGIYDAANQNFWTLSGQNTASFSEQIQSYGISYTPFIPVDGNLDVALIAYPYLPTQAYLTTVQDGNLIVASQPVSNPLLRQAFSAVTFLGTNITVVPTASSRYIYAIQSATFNDMQYGITSPEGVTVLNTLDLGEGMNTVAIAGTALPLLFIAQAQGTFGTDSSSIAFASRITPTVQINGQDTSCIAMIYQAQKEVTLDTAVLTAGGNALRSIGSQVIMYPYSASLSSSRVYVGLDVAASVDSQAVGLFIAQANQSNNEEVSSVDFYSVLPDEVASAGLITPVTAPGLQQVTVSNMTTTITSTGISYLITSRFNTLDDLNVYAMPMVTMSSNNDDNGKIADFDSLTTVFKLHGSTYRTQGFSQVITDAAQIDIQGSASVVQRITVGGGNLPLQSGQKISQLFALGDSVYATIQDPFAVGTTPGMFKSQALFDAQGRIMTWSPWQRVVGTDDQILFAMNNRTTGATMYISGAYSNDIQQTTWSDEGNYLQDFITKADGVLQRPSGVQAVASFPVTTPGFTNLPDAQVSLFAASGYQAVVLGQTGQLVDTTFQILEQTNETSITLNSDLGLNIGSVVSVEFGNDGSGNNWLFMAGDAGLAVLSKNDGAGFTNLPNDGAAQFLIADNQTCKTLGNFNFIKKIVSDGSYLYVMTINDVYRFAIAAEKFRATGAAALAAELVVSANQLVTGGYCTDMLVDNGLILLGTTAGLYSINVHAGLPGIVSQVIIPGGLPAVSKLQTISNESNFNQHFFAASNLYVLSVNFAFEQACLNRFTITDGVVTAIEDQLLPGQNGPLLILDYMSNSIFIDGSLGFASSYRIDKIPANLKYLQYVLQAGMSSVQILLQFSVTNLQIAEIARSLGNAGVVRDDAGGALVIGTDLGLLANA